MTPAHTRRPAPVGDELIRRAIGVARRARDHGNHPFGALISDAAGMVRLEAENTVVTTADCTGHAEMNAIRQACATLDPDVLATATLYTSTEPCAMCAGAIYWAGVSRVVFGLREEELRVLTGVDPGNPTLALPCREVFARGQRPIDVIGPLLEDEARAVHEGFWSGRTNATRAVGSLVSGPTEVEPGRRLYASDLERRLLDGVGVGPGETVLELASGFGALGLRLAERVRPGGRTICSDIRPERVDAIGRRVEETGAEDIDVRVLDMLRLELPDASVDGIVCRWGFMFPLPPEQAFAEAHRVLRPGHRLVLAAWADPSRNPWISLVDDALRDEGHPLPVDRRSPGRMFSLANPARLRALMTAAGFDGVVVDEVPLEWGYDDFDAYWEEEGLIPGPFEDYLRALPPASSGAIRERLRASLEPWTQPAGGYKIAGVTMVAAGRRS